MMQDFEVKAGGKKHEHEVRLSMPDFLGLASLVTGLFASHGISIQSGSIRTSGGRAAVWFCVTAPNPDWALIRKELEDLAVKIAPGDIAALRSEINARLIEFIRSQHESYSDRLSGIDLKIDQELSPNQTVMDITAQDSPAFLFETTNALSLVGVNIVSMEIRTEDGTIRDRFWVTNEAGQKITDKSKLRALRWAMLLMRHFTHLLPNVPDPAVALNQIVYFGKNLFVRDDFESILLTLKRSDALEDLSKMLGSSVFLWEEMIRLQHAPIFDMIGNRRVLQGRKTKLRMQKDLERHMAKAASFKEKVDALNVYKDREMFRIDLRHLLGKTSYLEEFAEEFSDLAEAVVGAAHRLAWRQALKKFAPPMVSKKERSRDAVMAMGKFGGRELGYASDLELLFVYTDDPDPASARSRANLRFYSELVSVFTSIIRAKNEGVFEMDFRLRPYGNSGPPAVSLNLFKSYYSPKGKAANFERQALIKLRTVCGSPAAGKAAEALRDAYVYGDRPFDFAEALALRERQRKELVEKGSVNAKYGRGGLLDVEYAAQALQVIHGRHSAAARDPNTLKALAALCRAGVIPNEKRKTFAETYVFMRELINALRIFRGNARDLAVPDSALKEFIVLGRRMGYAGPDAKVRNKFLSDLSRFMGQASALYEEVMRNAQNEECRTRPMFGAAPERFGLHAAELASASVPDSALGALKALGFRDPREAARRFRKLAGSAPARVPGAKILDELWPQWPAVADPDLALEHLEKFAALSPDPAFFWEPVADSPAKAALLLRLLGSSKYLSHLLIRYPEDWEWAQDESKITLGAARQAFAIARTARDARELRRLRHRETLRIALAETALGAPLEDVHDAFSALADHVLDRAAALSGFESGLCVIALGKWGGEELNYGSDIDFMLVCGGRPDSRRLVGEVERFLELVTAGDEALYRVDMRLRPRGNQGSLFLTAADAFAHYRTRAREWEYQALIKARPAAGDAATGEAFLKQIRPMVYGKKWNAAALSKIRAIKRRYEDVTRRRGEEDSDVKMGKGGIRDVEFTVQILQLLYGQKIPALKNPNTFRALDQIERRGLLRPNECRILREGHAFLRRIENRLQLFENQQTFTVPARPERRTALARSLGFFDGPMGRSADRFLSALAQTKAECRELFEKTFYGKK